MRFKHLYAREHTIVLQTNANIGKNTIHLKEMYNYNMGTKCTKYCIKYLFYTIKIEYYLIQNIKVLSTSCFCTKN